MTTKGKARPVTDTHAAVIDGILAGEDIGEVARKAGIHRNTLWRWKNDESHPVSQGLAEARAMYHAEAKRRVKGAVMIALEALESVIRNPNAQDKDRIAAAREILSRGGLVESKEVTVDAKDAARDSIVAMLAGGELDDDALDALAGDDDTEE